LLNGQSTSVSGAFAIWRSTAGDKITWYDESCPFYEPVLLSNPIQNGARVGNRKGIGVMWDSLVANLPLPPNLTLSYDGATWLNLTDDVSDPCMLLRIP